MALVLNATKEFTADTMNADSGGTMSERGDNFSKENPLNREQVSYKCNFCPGSFSSLYHLQCHNVYKHSSILSNHGDNQIQTGAADIKSQSIQQPITDTVIKVSESGALDLSRHREIIQPKPDNFVSSSVDSHKNEEVVSSSQCNENDASDNEDSDRLVIDTEKESFDQRNRNHTDKNKTSSAQSLTCLSTEGTSHPRHYENPPQSHYLHDISREKSFDRSHSINNQMHKNEVRPDFALKDEKKVPSNEIQPLDYRSRSPQHPSNTHQRSHDLPDNTHSKPFPPNTGSFTPYYGSHAEAKYPSLGNQSMENQSLLNMIPPLPNMSMMPNFPMPFGFSPFMNMMMPPNSFMPPMTPGNMNDHPYPLQGDTFPKNMMPNLPYNPNMNLQKSKTEPVHRNSGNKSKAKKGDKKQKDVVEIYQCKTCNRQFSQVGNFHNHMKTHESKTCACGICKMEFADSYELQRHMRTTHTGSMPYKCEQCDREFSQYNNLRRHLRVHNDKKYKCHLCGRTFNESFYLEMHMGSHTGERTYKCGVCNAVFSDNAELQKHVRTHSADELHTCEVCGKSFSKACVLRQHKKMHSGLRPFKCETCDKTFIHRHHLTIHSRMHSSNKPYVCKICKKEFSQTSHLYKHIRQHTEQPGVTEEMIHESLAPILEKMKQNKELPESNSPPGVKEEKMEEERNNENEKRTDEMTEQENHKGVDQMKNQHEAQSVKEGDLKSVDTKITNQNNQVMESAIMVDNQNEKEFESQLKEDSHENQNVKGMQSLCNENDSKNGGTEGTRMTHLIQNSLREMENLYKQHCESQDESESDEKSEHENKSDVVESDDNASDKTEISVASSVAEKRLMSSPHSEIPYHNQCLDQASMLSIPKCQPISILDKNTEVRDINRYSPISQSGESLNDEEFRPRCDSGTENYLPNNKQTPSTISPRVISADNVLREQQSTTENCPSENSRSDNNMPLKKRRRYTSRQKKKSGQEEDQLEVKGQNGQQTQNYQQMIQPIPPEAQQMYFLQLQQMQMALAANVMAAQGMMMQNASEQMKNPKGQPNRYFPDSNQNDIPIGRQPMDEMMKSAPYPMSMHGLPAVSSHSNSAFQNGSFMNYSMTKSGY